MNYSVKAIKAIYFCMQFTCSTLWGPIGMNAGRGRGQSDRRAMENDHRDTHTNREEMQNLTKTYKEVPKRLWRYAKRLEGRENGC